MIVWKNAAANFDLCKGWGKTWINCC